MEIRLSGLYTDMYQLTMAQAYFFNGISRYQATFNYFIRKIPFNGGEEILAGLENLLDLLEDLSFQTEDSECLESLGFSKQFFAELKHYRFSGLVHSGGEGEIVFLSEPGIRGEGGFSKSRSSNLLC